MRTVLATSLLIAFVGVAKGADGDNPFKNAKVGDWVEYKMTGQNIEGKTKMTITAKDDKEVSYEVTGSFSFMGKEMTAPVQTLKVDLTKPYDQIAAANVDNLKKTADFKIEKDGEGKEKLKVGDKEYDTNWIKYKSSTTTNNFTVTSDYKMWYSKDVPVSGLVRMDTSVTAGVTITTKLELTGYGRK
jgi:hypothetical protein